MIKAKASVILALALTEIKEGRQQFVCAAIQDVETQMRWDNKEDVKSNANKIWMRFKPEEVHDNLRNLQQWWPKGDPIRIETLEKAIAVAKKAND